MKNSLLSPTRLAALSGIAALTFGLAACSTSAATPVDTSEVDLSQVTLRVGDQVSGTESILKSAGELEDIPYEIEWSTFTSGPPQIEALNADQIDYAITGNTPPILGHETATTVIQAFDSPQENVSDAILVGPGSDITEVADLKGRSIGVARGSSAHGHLILQLEKAGISLDDVEVNYLQPTDAKNAFESGQLDAWAVWDPYTGLAELDGAEPLVTGEGVTNGYGFAVASDKALEDPERAAAIEDLSERVAKAYRWAYDNPEEWAEVFSSTTGLAPEAAKLNARGNRLAIPLNQDVFDSQNELIRAFVAAGVLPSEFNFEDQTSDQFNTTLEPYFD